MKVQKTNNQQSFGMAVHIKAKNMTSAEIGLIDKHFDLLDTVYSGLLARISVVNDGYRKFVFSVSKLPTSRLDRIKQFFGGGVIKTPSGNMGGATIDSSTINARFIDVVKTAHKAYLDDKKIMEKAQKANAKALQRVAAHQEAAAKNEALQKLRAKYKYDV